MQSYHNITDSVHDELNYAVVKIAVNTRLLLKDKLEGIGWFTYETLKRITTQHPGHEFIFLFDRKYHPDFIFSGNITPRILFPQARHPFLFYLYFEYSIPYILKRIKPDIFLSPDGYLSLRSDIPQVAVFHDLNFEHYPNDVSPLNRWHYKKFFPQYARKASKIATVSEYSKQDISKLYHIDPAKINVVYNGANEAFTPLQSEQIIQTRKKYAEGNPYFVFIGALHPRKNLINLFQAFDILKAKSNTPEKLVIVGEKMWWTPQIGEAYEQMTHKNEVIFTGRLGAHELHQVLGSALALTYVSYFEGFGIPIIEAFRCDVPVITSRITSMPEIAGDAALLVDPFDANDIASAMQQVISDASLRQTMITKGRTRSQAFSWQQSADKLWDTIQEVISKN